MLFCEFHCIILPRKSSPNILSNKTSNTNSQSPIIMLIPKCIQNQIYLSLLCSARSKRISRNNFSNRVGLFGGTPFGEPQNTTGENCLAIFESEHLFAEIDDSSCDFGEFCSFNFNFRFASRFSLTADSGNRRNQTIDNPQFEFKHTHNRN